MSKKEKKTRNVISNQIANVDSKSNALQELEEKIGMINLVSGQLDMPNSSAIFEIEDGEVEELASSNAKALEKLETAKKNLADYPQLIEFLSSSFNPYLAYNHFTLWRWCLRFLAAHTTRFAHLKNQNDMGIGEELFVAPIVLKIVNNKFAVNDDLLEMMLNIEDVRRLRLCEVCSNVFWAKRLDAWGCSPKHNVAIRQRKFRDNSKEKNKEAEKRKQKRQNWVNQNFTKKDGEN